MMFENREDVRIYVDKMSVRCQTKTTRCDRMFPMWTTKTYIDIDITKEGPCGGWSNSNRLKLNTHIPNNKYKDPNNIKRENLISDKGAADII